MSETLIINFATRGRPEQFLSSLQNITDTIFTKDYRILVSSDVDDDTMTESVLDKACEYPNVDIYFHKSVSKISAINANVQHFGLFYWCINHSDDFVYTVKHWDQLMLNQITSVWGNSTDFFAHFNDGFVGDKLPTLNVCGYDYFQRDKLIYDSSYGSMSSDAENWHKAIMRGRHHYFPDLYFKHIHPANVPSMEVDQTYRRNDKFGDADTANYFHRMSQGFFIENPVFIPAEVQEHINKRLTNESK